MTQTIRDNVTSRLHVRFDERGAELWFVASDPSQRSTPSVAGQRKRHQAGASPGTPTGTR